MAVMQPSTITGWNIQKWQRTFEDATYQKMVGIPLVDEGDRPLNQLNIRKHLRVSGSTLAQTAEGLTLTYSTLADTAATLSPVGSYVAAAWSENFEAQIDANLDSESRGNIEAALAELTDSNFLANFASLTNVISCLSVDGPTWRKAVGRLMGNTNGVAMPGGGTKIHGVFSHTQYPAMCEIEEFNRADVRGGSETPYVSGLILKAGGVTVHFSTVITQDANGYENAVFIPSAFCVAWNVRSRLKRQDIELQNRIIAYNNVASGIKHNSRAIAIRATASSL